MLILISTVIESPTTGAAFEGTAAEVTVPASAKTGVIPVRTFPNTMKIATNILRIREFRLDRMFHLLFV
jgi:hypothetical protein